MRIIISPAKKMVRDTDTFMATGKPALMDKALILKDYLVKRSYEELKSIWQCNEKLALLNYERLRETDISKGQKTPAVIAYDGIQYQYMSPKTLEKDALLYIEKNLRILSGLYGVLGAMDGVEPYRLEMQARLEPPLSVENGDGRITPCASLYDFWGEDICRELFSGEDTVLNLASKEYSKAVEPYIKEGDRFISCAFCELKEGKPKQKATLSKMARGEAVRFMAQTNTEKPEDIKNFSGLGFSFEEKYSDENNYVFVR